MSRGELNFAGTDFIGHVNVHCTIDSASFGMCVLYTVPVYSGTERRGFLAETKSSSGTDS